MNLINFVNLETASQPIESLGVEGKAGIFPMEAGLANGGKGKAFGATFTEQLKRDGLEPGLQKREPALTKDGTAPREGKPADGGTSDMTGENPAKNGSPTIRGKQDSNAPDTADTGANRIPGRLRDWKPDAPAKQVSVELVEGSLLEASSTGVDPEVADTLESRSIPADLNTEEAPEENTDPETKGKGIPGVPGNEGEGVPKGNWIPEDQETIKDRNNPNGEPRPVTWTREHVSGEKLLPERTERPNVPQQAQARFARGTSVPSAGENTNPATVDPAATTAERPGSTGSGSSLSVETTQTTGETVSLEEPAVHRSEATGGSNRAGERPEVPPQAQARFARAAEVPERPEVPPQAQARFARTGEVPERPEVPQQAQARFTRESGQPADAVSPSASSESTVRQAANPVDASNPVVVSTGEPEGTTEESNQRHREVGREASRSTRARLSIINEPDKRAEKANTVVKAQGRDKQESPQMAERITEIRARIPEKAAATSRSQLFQSKQQSPANPSANTQVSASTVSQANVPVEVAETAIPETVSDSPDIRRRESPKDRYNRLAEARSASSESVASQEKELAAAQKSLVDPARRAAPFLVGRDKEDTSKNERNREVDHSKDQGTRADKSSTSQGKALGAVSRTQTVQLSSVNDAFLKIMSTVERVAQNAVTSRVQLHIDLENGENMKVMLKVAKGHVQTVFMTDSDGLRGAMKEGWEQFQRQLSEKGFVSGEPEFRGNGQDRENARHQAQKNWDDLLDDTAFAQPEGIQSAASGVAEPGPAPVSATSRHALDAYA